MNEMMKKIGDYRNQNLADLAAIIVRRISKSPYCYCTIFHGFLLIICKIRLVSNNARKGLLIFLIEQIINNGVSCGLKL